MNKKVLVLATAFVCAASAAAAAYAVPRASVRAEDDGRQRAIFLQGVTLEKQEEEYLLTYRFDKAVSAGEAFDESDKRFFIVNGTPLSEAAGTEFTYTADKKGIAATLPAGLIKEGEKTSVNVLGGFISETNCVTTVRYLYEFSALGNGKRIYRSDNLDDYDELTVTSVSVPTTEGANFTFYIYFSDAVTPKKYIDLQARDKDFLFNNYLDSNPDNHTDYKYTSSELEMLYQYEIYGALNPMSFNHQLLFGCQEMNGLRQFPGNAGNGDMTPKLKASGLDLYDVYQIQESVADQTVFYLDKAGEKKSNTGSLQPLAIQVHVDNNWIQVVLKGDSQRDKELKTTLNGTAETGLTSFRENLIPDRKAPMAFCVRRGLLFPNGKAVKADTTYVYDPVRKAWVKDGETSPEAAEDDTLSNQEGYTDEELAALGRK